jgi:hypothetical protein
MVNVANFEPLAAMSLIPEGCLYSFMRLSYPASLWKVAVVFMSQFVPVRMHGELPYCFYSVSFT